MILGNKMMMFDLIYFSKYILPSVGYFCTFFSCYHYSQLVSASAIVIYK